MRLQTLITWLFASALLASMAARPVEAASPTGFSTDFSTVVRDVQTKVVKIYGAGGLRGLEAYQSGIVISAEGHILTAWSYVLDSESTTIVLDDGRHFQAELLGADPLTELAVLKCEVGDAPLPHFDLSHDSATAAPGARVLALSNLFGIATGTEAVSVVHGVVSAVAPLAARKGAFSARYQGRAYIVDAAANNPGAAGGALVDVKGHLLGILGKEVRSQLTGTWLNYALPVDSFSGVVEAILEGRHQAPPLDALTQADNPLQLGDLGIVLVPNVVARTPPFVDYVEANSPAKRAGLRPDDLVVMINQQAVNSCSELAELCARFEQDDSIAMTITMTILRDGELLDVELKLEL